MGALRFEPNNNTIRIIDRDIGVFHNAACYSHAHVARSRADNLKTPHLSIKFLQLASRRLSIKRR